MAITFSEDKKEMFCDLQCYACHGFYILPCLLLKGNKPLRFASFESLAKGEYLKLEPKGRWARAICLDFSFNKKISFPVYKGEIIN